jgi:hypothetical protein
MKARNDFWRYVHVQQQRKADLPAATDQRGSSAHWRLPATRSLSRMESALESAAERLRRCLQPCRCADQLTLPVPWTGKTDESNMAAIQTVSTC